MVTFFETIIECFENYVLSHSYFISGEYYLSLFSKYFSVAGFIIGFIFVLLVYFSSAEDQRKAGFFKVLPFVAVINSCMVIFTFLNSIVGSEFYQYMPGMLGVTDNIVSGFILTLVIRSCYKGYSGSAFLLGVVTFAALPMLNFTYLDYFEKEALVQMVIRVVMVGFLCVIISHRKYFYTGWIWYFVFHVLMRTIVLFTPMFLKSIDKRAIDTTGYSFSMVLDYFLSFRVDYIVFAIVLFFAIIFERLVISVKFERSTT